MTIEKEFEDSPAFGYLPEGAKFMCDHPSYFDIHAPKSEINRWSLDTGIGEAPNKLYDVEYKEDVLVGYRWYDTKQIEPLFPFGFGLSYTNFTLEDLQLSSSEITEDQTLKVTVKVTNTGDQAGATVVQVYVGEKTPTLTRRVKELKSLKKVMLNVGESKVVELALEKDAFAFWNPETKEWTVNKGEFDISVGESSKDVAEVKTVEVK